MSSRVRARVRLGAAIVVWSVVLVAVSAAAGGSGYAGSNAGIVNVQASTTPITMACPVGASWNRDPDVCAQRWSTSANDRSESDIAVDPTNPNHIVGMSKAFFSPKDYLFRLV